MRLRITPISDEPPVQITLQLPADTHRDLLLYADLLSRESNLPPVDPARLIAPMLERFLKADRAFNKARHLSPGSAPEPAPFG